MPIVEFDGSPSCSVDAGGAWGRCRMPVCRGGEGHGGRKNRETKLYLVFKGRG